MALPFLTQVAAQYVCLSTHDRLQAEPLSALPQRAYTQNTVRTVSTRTASDRLVCCAKSTVYVEQSVCLPVPVATTACIPIPGSGQISSGPNILGSGAAQTLISYLEKGVSDITLVIALAFISSPYGGKTTLAVRKLRERQAVETSILLVTRRIQWFPILTFWINRIPLGQVSDPKLAKIAKRFVWTAVE